MSEPFQRTLALCQNLKREHPDARVVLAVKDRAVEEVRAAAQALLETYGEVHLGENYVQQAQTHQDALANSIFGGHNVAWHFFGNIQTNKISKIAALVGANGFAHSISSVEMAQKFAAARQRLNLPALNVFLEVNIGDEPTKHGIRPGALTQTARAIQKIAGLNVLGLMSLPPEGDAEGKFLQKALELNRALGFRQISLGTSVDYARALTLAKPFELERHFVRVGEAVFGPRV